MLRTICITCWHTHTLFYSVLSSEEENEICFWVNLILPSSQHSWGEQQKAYIALLYQTSNSENSFFLWPLLLFSLLTHFSLSVRVYVREKHGNDQRWMWASFLTSRVCVCVHKHGLKRLLLFVDFVKFHCLPSSIHLCHGLKLKLLPLMKWKWKTF